MKTKIIQLFGGPCSGKSTLAAGLFYELKKAGYEAELVTEHAKEWAWEGRAIGKYDQVALISEQIKRQARLHGKVEYIVTDSPIRLCPIYEIKLFNTGLTFRLCDQYYYTAETDGVKFLNFVLPKPTHF